MVMTPRIAPNCAPGNRSAVLAVIAGPRAPQVSPKKQACSHSSRCWSGLVISSAQIDADDREPVGHDRRHLAADIIGQRAGDDRAEDREKRAHAEHLGGIDPVEADIDREGELVQRDEKAAEPGEQVDREQAARNAACASPRRGSSRRRGASGRRRRRSGFAGWRSLVRGGAQPDRRGGTQAASGNTTAAINAACTR